MDNDVAKQTQKILAKQGMKFKLNTKVMGGDASGSGVSLKVEAAKGGKEETVSCYLTDLNPTCTNSTTSSTPTLSSSQSVADLTQRVSDSRTSASKPTTRAA